MTRTFKHKRTRPRTGIERKIRLRQLALREAFREYYSTLAGDQTADIIETAIGHGRVRPKGDRND